MSKLVVPGRPDDSHLLMYPLVPEEGGAAYHSGGRQWPSKSDPNWQAIARWVNGQKYPTGQGQTSPSRASAARADKAMTKGSEAPSPPGLRYARR